MTKIQTRRPIAALILGSLLVTVALFGLSVSADERVIVSLDGTWQIAEGSMDKVPKQYDHQVPVPGLVDMATPPFEEVGAKPKNRRRLGIGPTDTRREAFWYRRSFTVDGPVPPVALLKIHKAKFGTRVYLNAQLIGDHPGNFTPGYFDLRPHLKGNGQPNTLTVRVGSSPAAVVRGRPWGADGEKARYLPGIYDNVELILSGTPHVVNVQTVPDLPGKAVRVVAEVANAGDAPVEVPLGCQVREWKSDKAAGRATSHTVRIKPGATSKIDITVPIENCRLWTPEDPFLYTLEVNTGADTYTTRFGVRSVTTDPEAGRIILNGKPYFLRGSNVCIYRFFEDPLRGNKPWDEAWVEKLHRQFKAMHWNSLRYCIGFPPEAWYDVADELGILIQDEYPIWGTYVDGKLLSTEYTQWMRERWNHPCVAIWDAQNETPGRRGRITRDAILKVRHLDLSGRPWDNGWGPRAAEGDICEAHPYVNRQRLVAKRLVGMGELSGEPHNTPLKLKPWKPYIINEYAWLWLNRDGTPTTLSNRGRYYPAVLGPGLHAPEVYRNMYARYLAAMTEFWRARRKCAGVLHFCGLGYSRPDGQTSDNFVDLEKLQFDPFFWKYVRDSFSPVGVMIDYWNIKHPTNIGSLEVPVVVTNDLDEPWQGKLVLKLTQGDQVLQQQQQDVSAESQGQETLTLSIELPRKQGDFLMVAELHNVAGQVIRSWRTIEMFDPGLAVGCPASASSELTLDGHHFPANLAVDGRPGTRWSSEFSDPQWIAVDLGKVQPVVRVEIDWEKAAAAAYSIDVSEDGKNWQAVYQTDQGRGRKEVIRFTRTPARWVRMHGTERTTRFGYSIWEMRVFGGDPSDQQRTQR